MRIISAVIMSLLLSFAVSLQADHSFKFDKPVKLVSESKNPRVPEIVWDGSRFAVVYDDYSYDAAMCNVYLIFVDANGNVVNGPTKLSNQKCALGPKIVWTGTEYFILYAAGKGFYNLEYYLERYDNSGIRLSQQNLPGECNYYSPERSSLFWMGNKLGIFYYAKPEGEYYSFMLFCTADGSGIPSATLQRYDSYSDDMVIHWNGKNFVVYSGIALDSIAPEGVAQMLTLKPNGQIIGRKIFSLNAAPIYSCRGVELVPLKRKGSYLAVLSGLYYKAIGSSPSAATISYRADYFVGSIKAKNKKIGDLNAPAATSEHGYYWTFPDGVSMGNKYYIAAGRAGGIGFIELDSKGKLVGKPIYYTVGGVEYFRPRAVGAGNAVGVVWEHDGLYFNIIEP